MAGPGIRSGTLERQKFMHISDWTPTILDLAGIDPATTNPDFDGHSFKDVFVNDAESPREDLFYFLKASPAVNYSRIDPNL